MTRQRVINWLRNAVYEIFIQDPEPGTCGAIYDHEAWKTWETAGCPHPMWLTGVQGVGKSVHCRSIMHRAAGKGERVILSYFFGGTGGKQSNCAQSFATSILWQLFHHQEVYMRTEFTSILPTFQPFLNTYPDVRNCNVQGLLRHLSCVLEIVERFLVVVDAIDECMVEAAELQEYLNRLGRQPNAKLIISAQNQSFQSEVEDSFSHVRLDRYLVEPDIVQYLERKIRSSKKVEISRIVLSRSKGIFLHTRLLVDDLKSAKSVNEQMEKIARSGDRVPDEYRRQFSEHDEKLSVDERDQRDCILRILLAAKTPMSVNNVSEILAFDDSSRSIDENGRLLEPAKTIIYLCRPLVEVMTNGLADFIHGSAKDFLLNQHLTVVESDLFLARKALMALREERYRKLTIPSQLLRKHLLAGTIYCVKADEQLHEYSELYDYATLYFQDHVTELKHPPEDILEDLAGFLIGIEFVSYSEHLMDLTKQPGLSYQIRVYNILLSWVKDLPASIKNRIPIDDYFEKAHLTLSESFRREKVTDKVLKYLPLIRNGDYFNNGGQSTDDWQRAYKYKEMVVSGFSKIFGDESPVTLRALTSLLQEYFWQKRYDEVLPQLLKVAKAQRLLGADIDSDLYTTLWLLGLAYHCLTRLEEALVVFTEGAEGVAHQSGKSARQYLLISLYKGHSLEQLFRFHEATLLYEEVKKTLTDLFGAMNGFTLMSQTAVGAVQRKQRRYKDAEKNLFEGWDGRKKLFSINVNVCLDAAVQLALFYRDNMDGKACLELLDAVSESIVYQEDFERYCQTQHIRALAAFDNGDFEEPKMSLIRLIQQASGPNRGLNNRELMWSRETLAQVERHLGQDDEALNYFLGLVELAEEGDESLADEPEPPCQLRLAEKAVHLMRDARVSDARDFLRENGLRWVREADFYILGVGGPIADTAVIAPIRFPASSVER